MERTYNQELIIALNQEQRNELTIFMDWLFFISKKKKTVVDIHFVEKFKFTHNR